MSDNDGAGTWDDGGELEDEFGKMVLEVNSLSPKPAPARRSTPAASPMKTGNDTSPEPNRAKTPQERRREARVSAPGSPTPYNDIRGRDGISPDPRGSSSSVEKRPHLQRLRQEQRHSSPDVHNRYNDQNFYPHPGSVSRGLRYERSDTSVGTRRSSIPYDPKRDPQEGFIGHPKHYGFGSTKRFWEPASGGEQESKSLFYFGTPDRRQATRQATPEGRRRRPSSAASERPSVMEQTMLTPGGKVWRPFGANWQAGRTRGWRVSEHSSRSPNALFSFFPPGPPSETQLVSESPIRSPRFRVKRARVHVFCLVSLPSGVKQRHCRDGAALRA